MKIINYRLNIILVLIFLVVLAIGNINFTVVSSLIIISYLLSTSIVRLSSSTVFLISFFLCLTASLLVTPNLISDFDILHRAATSSLEGNHQYQNDIYFKNYPYQIGYVYYQYLILSLFDKNLLALQVINCLFISGAAFLIYKICRFFSDENSSLVSSFAYATYIPVVISAPLLNNQYPSIFLYLLAIYFLLNSLEKDVYGYLLLGGIFTALGNFLRPEAPIIIISVFLYFIASIKLKDLNSSLVHNLKKVVIYIGAYYLTSIALNKYLNYIDFFNGKLINGNPLWKFTLGLNIESNGSYSQKVAEIVEAAKTLTERDQVQKTIILENLSKPLSIAKLFYIKVKTMWFSNDSIIWWTLQGSSLEGRSGTISKIAQLQYYFYVIISLVGAMTIFKEKYVKLILLLLCTFFSIHLLIEVQSRYRYFSIPFIVIFFGPGVSKLHQKFIDKTAILKRFYS